MCGVGFVCVDLDADGHWWSDRKKKTKTLEEAENRTFLLLVWLVPEFTVHSKGHQQQHHTWSASLTNRGGSWHKVCPTDQSWWFMAHGLLHWPTMAVHGTWSAPLTNHGGSWHMVCPIDQPWRFMAHGLPHWPTMVVHGTRSAPSTNHGGSWHMVCPTDQPRRFITVDAQMTAEQMISNRLSRQVIIVVISNAFDKMTSAVSQPIYILCGHDLCYITTNIHPVWSWPLLYHNQYTSWVVMTSAISQLIYILRGHDLCYITTNMHPVWSWPLLYNNQYTSCMVMSSAIII